MRQEGKTELSDNLDSVVWPGAALGVVTCSVPCRVGCSLSVQLAGRLRHAEFSVWTVARVI